MIVIIGCNKGGAGKSTTAMNVTVALARRGADVCLVDADQQRSSAKWQADREANNLSPAITLIERRGSITSTLKALSEKYEYVIVDVAGRNSRELITGAAIADIIIAPHQCSQLDLDTLGELAVQLEMIRDLNPDLKVSVYHSMASTNPALRAGEREEFLKFMGDFPTFHPLESIGYYRKAYRDAVPRGISVLEGPNANAADDINDLVNEVFGHA